MNAWTCVNDIELDGLIFGHGETQQLTHVFSCPACRARLLLARDAIAEMATPSAAGESLSLAAKGAKTAMLRALVTSDESLICRIERESDNALRITVLADTKQWGDAVVIWPGANEPILATVGETIHSHAGNLSVVGLWQVSQAEAAWNGDWTDLPQQFNGMNSSIGITGHGDWARLSSLSPVLTVAAYHDERNWRMLNLPESLPRCERLELLLFTPLSAVPLK